MMVAKVTGLNPGEFVHTFGDAHIYLNHIDQVKLQLTREPFKLPVMLIKREVSDITDFRFDDFELVGYISHPHIKGEISV
jgi:thymidylate synthase